MVLVGACDVVPPWRPAPLPTRVDDRKAVVEKPKVAPQPTPQLPRFAVAPPSARPDFWSLGTGLGVTLRQLATAQRVYRRQYWKYATTLAALGWRADDDIVLQLTSVTANGWAAVAIHRAVPSRSCVYYEGSVSRPPTTFAERRPGIEKSVVCDSF
jgi:hypothetical protein